MPDKNKPAKAELRDGIIGCAVVCSGLTCIVVYVACMVRLFRWIIS